MNQLFAFGPLAAIWMTNPIMIAGKFTRRITEGDQIRIENGQVSLTSEPPTHQITACMGELTDNFEIHVIDLKTRELSIVKI